MTHAPAVTGWRHRARGFLARALCLLAVASLCAHANASVDLKFGVYTSDKPTVMVKKFRPMLRALERRLSEILVTPVRIRIDVARDYNTGLERLIRGDVDFSRFGPASYIAARTRDSRVNVLAMESRHGGRTFYGVICVRADSPIKSIAELRGQRFAFGNKRSTIGRYLAQSLLIENQIYARDLKQIAYLGRHDKVAQAVATAQFDAGAVKENSYRKAVSNGAQLRVLARFENVTKPWVAAGHVETRVRQALREALLGFDEKGPLQKLKVDGFVSGNDEHYAPIRAAIEQAQAF